MPEKGVIRLFEREVGWEERQLSSKVDKTNPANFYDVFFTQLPVAAAAEPEYYCNSCGSSTLEEEGEEDSQSPPDVDNNSEDISVRRTELKHLLHKLALPEEDEEDPQSPLDVDDELEDSLPDTQVPKFTAKFVNTLRISGRIHAKARGKELIIAICNSDVGRNFLLRVNFGLEAHCFWIPTEWYKKIVSNPPVPRGKKSFAYQIPYEFIDGPARDRLISLQAAFVRPEWTLVFVDHNVMIQFHLMQVSASFLPSHLEPGSKIWSRLWSRTHGPVYHQEPQATLECLEAWRSDIIDTRDSRAIFQAIKTTQTVFNGCGTQETNDLLLLAFIHPQMPTFEVCSDAGTWSRFQAALIKYDADRATLARPTKPLPYVSGPRPFHFNTDGHRKCLNRVSAYRRSEVIFTSEDITIAHRLGLFLSNAFIDSDGQARATGSSIPSIPVQLRPQYNKMHVPNFAITWHIGKAKYVAYTPFTAKPPAHWQRVVRETVGSDVREEVNKTTLGLYSFRLLVDCIWSSKTVSEEGIPQGRRPVLTVGSGNRKRPLAQDIAKTGAPKKKRRVVTEEKENIVVDEGIRTRSGRLLN
ncbi:hypothetical protein DFH08DRAFT_801726 [Mycena albidolilacea]|uniref:Uncharacterized protein n=1 Tax=Mycena albidolilacea TaxID=1033008 RepID=A0AAD7F1U9_9AGAR|nr:hypothetical protein DFH08DRAFT_801726 [Mycena albidolilacea]